VVTPGEGLVVVTMLDAARAWASGVLAEHLAPSRQPLAEALLIGRRDGLPRDAADDYLATGTVHILSISGLHVGLLAWALFRGCRLVMVPQRWSLAVVAATTGLYMLLVRAETPVLRATLLVWLACLAAALSRRPRAINSLAVAAIVVLVVRPTEVWSAGAQLSFLSTAVLIGMAAVLPRSHRSDDPIERLIERSRSPAERVLRSLGRNTWIVFLAGAAVWMATAPLVASRFHMVSPVGLLLNVLIAPIVAVAMAAGFACLAMAPLSSMLAGVCGWTCDATLATLEAIVHVAACLPAGHAWVAGPPTWWVTGWYVAMAATLLWCSSAALARPYVWAGVAAAWMAVGLTAEVMVEALAPVRGGLRGIVADLGHGLGTVITTPSGRCLVFDAGRLGAPAAARRILSAVLWSERITRIDTLVLSHADADHLNGVPGLLERFSVGEVVVPPALMASDATTVREVVAALTQRGIPIRPVKAGDSFAIDPHCRVRVVGGGEGSNPGDVLSDNETSLVMAVESAGRRWLLTGDLEGRSLSRFVAADPDTCDVLVAPHHGSLTSLPADIALATRPEVVLVSGAGGRGWPTVQAAYAQAAGDAEVLLTGRTGAIAVDADAATLVVRRFRDGRWHVVEGSPRGG